MGQEISLSGIELRDRDISILKGLFESRVMTLAHIAALYFDSKPEAAKKRVQRLKAAGLIAQRPRKPNEPAVLTIGRKGFDVLSASGHLAVYPPQSWSNVRRRGEIRDMHLRHELDVMDVKAAFCTSIRAESRLSVLEFSTWPLLFEFRACPSPGAADVTVKPDGYIRIEEREVHGDLSEYTFFLEVDRSSEVQLKLADKAACYANYYRAGGLAERLGHDRSEYKQFPFLMLFVFKTAERRNNTAEQLLWNNPPVQTQAWLSTIAEVTTNPLGRIWITPLDYQNASAETAFDPRRPRSRGPYRRDGVRQRLVEGRIIKRCLIHSNVPKSGD
jgi:hypothetical protein